MKRIGEVPRKHGKNFIPPRGIVIGLDISLQKPRVRKGDTFTCVYRPAHARDSAWGMLLSLFSTDSHLKCKAMAARQKNIKCRSSLTKSKSGWIFSRFAGHRERFRNRPKNTPSRLPADRQSHVPVRTDANKGEFTIGVSKPIREKLGLNEGDTVSIRLDPDTSKYGVPMPEDFAEVLRQDPDGDRLFHALTAGMQRILIYMIGQGVKNLDRRSTSASSFSNISRKTAQSGRRAAPPRHQTAHL